MAARQNGVNASERERGIIEAYLAGAKWTEIEERFGVGRSTISHVLRRSGVVPSRARRHLDTTSAETALSRLLELIAFQDQRIIELETEVSRLRGSDSDQVKPKATRRKGSS